MSRPVTAPTLTEFLLARIAEDEAVVKAVTPYNPQHGYSDVWASHDGEYTQSDAAFVDHNDPARVLAECEAKRRIVEEARNAIRLSDETHDDGSPKAERIHGYATAWESTIDTLAAVYADHPDYDEAWRP